MDANGELEPLEHLFLKEDLIKSIQNRCLKWRRTSSEALIVAGFVELRDLLRETLPEDGLAQVRLFVEVQDHRCRRHRLHLPVADVLGPNRNRLAYMVRNSYRNRPRIHADQRKYEGN